MYNETIFINTIIKILNCNNINSDKIHVQKFISFLADKYDEVPFDFAIYKYGPFSGDLRCELDSMVLWQELKFENKNYQYIEGNDILESEEYKKLENDIINYSNLIKDLSFQNMEIYGTLLYFMKRSDRPTDKYSILAKFNEEKSNKYSKNIVSEAYDRLKDTYFNGETV